MMRPFTNQNNGLPPTDQQISNERKFHKLTPGGILKPPSSLSRPDLTRTRTLRSTNDSGSQPQMVQTTLTSTFLNNNQSNQNQLMQSNNLNSHVNPLQNVPPSNNQQQVQLPFNNNSMQSLPNGINSSQNSQNQLQFPSSQNRGLPELKPPGQMQMNLPKTHIQLRPNNISSISNQQSMNTNTMNNIVPNQFHNNSNQFPNQNPQNFPNHMNVGLFTH